LAIQADDDVAGEGPMHRARKPGSFTAAVPMMTTNAIIRQTLDGVEIADAAADWTGISSPTS